MCEKREVKQQHSRPLSCHFQPSHELFKPPQQHSVGETSRSEIIVFIPLLKAINYLPLNRKIYAAHPQKAPKLLRGRQTRREKRKKGIKSWEGAGLREGGRLLITRRRALAFCWFPSQPPAPVARSTSLQSRSQFSPAAAYQCGRWQSRRRPGRTLAGSSPPLA